MIFKLKKISFMKKIIVLLSSLYLFSNCATILDGSRTRVRVYGSPNDAEVYYNGAFQGKGKQTIAVQKSAVKNGTAKIEVKREGYEPTTMTLNKKTQSGYIVLDILFGVVPLFFDIATGNLTAVRPGEVEYKLQKKAFQAKDVNQYSVSLIGKKVKFKLKDKEYQGVVFETFENREANIKYTDENGKILNAWKRFNDFLEM